MRLQEILNENLEWGNGLDKDVYMSLKGLVNKNEGVYKSRKQRWFIENRLVGSEPDRDRGFVKDNFGVDVGDGEKFISVEAMAVWADYGSRSQIPVRYGFVIDDIGVVKFYKVGNKGNMRDGASPEPSKTKLEWTRPEGVDASHLEKSEEEKKKEFKAKLGMSEGNYIGTEGERIAFALTLVAKKYLDTTQVSYNVSAEKWWNMYEDADGNVVYHTGKEGPEKGAKIIGKATVKKHLVNKKGQKVTVVIRPRFKLVESKEKDGQIIDYKGYSISQDTTSINHTNPVSGHEWTTYKYLKKYVISGPDVLPNTSFRTVKGAKKHIDFLVKFPFNRKHNGSLAQG